MPYLSLISPEVKPKNALQLRKDYVYKLFGNRCYDCRRVKGKKCFGKISWNLHHLSYPYGYDPEWDWIHATNKVFEDDMLPEIKAVCILLCNACHRKRHNLPPKNRRVKWLKQCNK